MNAATKNENGTYTVRNGFGTWTIDDKRIAEPSASAAHKWAEVNGFIVSVPTQTGAGCLVSMRDGHRIPVPRNAPKSVWRHIAAYEI